MSVTCNDLLKLSVFRKIELVAGAGGLDRIITWPYVGQTASVSDWVHGGELLFITGIAHTESMLPKLLEECIDKHLSGLVILTGDQYIRNLPNAVIQRADEADFPLFVMPWELKLIDVTRDITGLLMFDQLERKKVERLFGHILFAPMDEMQEAVDNAALGELKLENFNFVAIFTLSQITISGNKSPQEEKLQQYILNLCEKYSIKTYTMIYGSSVLVLTSAPTRAQAERNYDYITGLRDTLSHLSGDDNLLLSCGNIHKGVVDIRTSYQEAISTLSIMRRLSRKYVGHYRNLGIYRLLLQIKDTNELELYYHSQLDPLLEHDANNDADFLLTLKTYLKTQCNVTKTAQALFLHRNTLVYRINKIKDLLGKDLEDAQVCLELMMAIIIKEYLTDGE